MHGSKHKHSKINSVRTQIHRHTAAADEAINIDLSDWWQHLSYHREFSSRIRYALRMHTDPKTDINMTFTFFSQPFFVSREDYNKKQKDKKLRSLLKHRKMCHIIELSENKSGGFFFYLLSSLHMRGKESGRAVNEASFNLQKCLCATSRWPDTNQDGTHGSFWCFCF